MGGITDLERLSVGAARQKRVLPVDSVWSRIEVRSIISSMSADETVLPTSTQLRVFISYSSEPQMNEWVRRLGERLMSNGIEVVLDQWNTALGDDLAHFMETGLTGAERVIAVCSDSYVSKANAGVRGVGYEKKIMTAPLLQNATSNHVVPVLRGVTVDPPVPTFLVGTKYVNFSDDSAWDEKYRELVFDLYGEQLYPVPPLGPNPFAASSQTATMQQINFDPTRFQSAALEGTVTWPYEDNNGRFVIGSGSDAFTIMITESGYGSVHVYNDPPDIATIAVASNTALEDVRAPETYDSSSRARTARVGDSVIMVSTQGRVAAFEVQTATTRDTSSDGQPSVTIKYSILPRV